MNKATRVFIFFVAVLLPSCACEPSPLEDIAGSRDTQSTTTDFNFTTTTTSTTHPDMVGLAATKQQLVLIPPTTTTTTSVPPTTTAPTSPPTTSQPPPASVSGDVWWDLAGCETGGTYNMAIHNPSGKYHGAFQFDIPTWRSVGGPGDPHEHPYEVQLHYAKILQSQRGWHPWPTCARKLGLIE